MADEGRTRRAVALVAALTVLAGGTVASFGVSAGASGALTDTVPGSVGSSLGIRRPGSQVPVVLGPTPVQPTNVAAAPARRSSGVRAQSTGSSFVVNYDAGFNANPAAKAAFQYAVNQWSNLIGSPVPIVVNASFTALPPGVLGSAGPNSVFRDFSGAPQAGTWYPGASANALHGSDLAPSGADIDAGFSSSFAGFYFGTDGNTAGKVDFVSVVMHELGHGLGFIGVMDVNGDGTGSCCLAGFPLSYDRLTTSNGTPLLSLTDGSTALGNALHGPVLRFTGAQATAANGGTAPRLYGPNPWQSGSSYAHLDEATYPAGNANSLMTPSIGANEVIHSPGPVTLGIFADTGWTVGGLPTVSIGRASIVEGNSATRYLRFNVSLSDPASHTVSVNYTTIDGAATGPADYTLRSGTLVIPANTSASTIAIAVKGDMLTEGTHRFSVKLSGAAGAVIGKSIVSGIILDDEPSSGLTVSVGDATIVEGNSGNPIARVTVSLSRSNPTPVSVVWATGGGSATAGSDYTAASGTVTFPANTTYRSVSINVSPDLTSEVDESVRIQLSNPIGVTIRRATGTATIANDD